MEGDTRDIVHCKNKKNTLYTWVSSNMWISINTVYWYVTCRKPKQHPEKVCEGTTKLAHKSWRVEDLCRNVREKEPAELSRQQPCVPKPPHRASVASADLVHWESFLARIFWRAVVQPFSKEQAQNGHRKANLNESINFRCSVWKYITSHFNS